MSSKSPITTHVLDTSLGRPAVGVAVSLEWLSASGEPWHCAEGVTNSDGRVVDLLELEDFKPGQYRLIFATGAYYARQSISTFYPQVQIEFTVADVAQHYHVPLLLSPFGYSTYRGS